MALQIGRNGGEVMAQQAHLLHGDIIPTLIGQRVHGVAVSDGQQAHGVGLHVDGQDLPRFID